MQPGDRFERVSSIGTGKSIRGTIRGIEGRMIHVEFDARPGVTIQYPWVNFVIPELRTFRVLSAVEVLAELA